MKQCFQHYLPFAVGTADNGALAAKGSSLIFGEARHVVMHQARVWAVIPAHNEVMTIGPAIDGLHMEGWENIVVVDDGSADATAPSPQALLSLRPSVALF
jgi:hypothetical protein